MKFYYKLYNALEFRIFIYFQRLHNTVKISY